MTTYQGALEFYSETGTEGGYWAFQDEKFTGIPNNDRSCTRCGAYWSESRPDEPKPKFTYWLHDPRPRYLDGYHVYDEPQDLPLARDASEEFNIRWTKRTNELALACYQNGHEGWKPVFPNGMSSYEGLHVLDNGDQLTIFDKDDPTKVVWEGQVELKRFDLFAEDAQGLWIHADQKGIDRVTWSNWFFNHNPARLTTAK